MTAGVSREVGPFRREKTMKGFIYRLSVQIKDFGERIHCSPIVWLGLAIREWALKLPVLKL
jgi:hypothetical protein